MISNKMLSTVITKTGIDATIEFTDSETKVKYQKTFASVSQRELDHDLNNRIVRASDKIAARIADDKIKKEWSREELGTLLKKKGYLVEGKTVEDLPQKTVEVK